MSKEILYVVESLSNIKRLSKEQVFEVVEAALEAATKKCYDNLIDVRVQVDQKTGEYQTYRRWLVVEEPEMVEDDETQIALDTAREKQSDIKASDYLEEEIESIDFGRIAAQNAKQVILQKVKEAERKLMAETHRKNIGNLLTGTVKRVTRDNIIVDLGENVEMLIARSELLPHDSFRLNDRIRSALIDINDQPRGPLLIGSRTNKAMLIALFKIEVPEVGEEVIEIKAAARDPGSRAKIAVKTNDGRIDPIGACVGMRGARVQAVSNELNGERVDIILYDNDPVQLVINAMAPAEVQSIVVDEDSHSMDVAVKEEHLSQAIGRNGQNVKLASELTGWTLNVLSTKDAQQKNEAEADNLLHLFMESLEVDQEVAEILVNEGFMSLDEIAYIPQEEFEEIEEFDEEIIAELRQRAKDALLAQALEAKAKEHEPAKDLLDLPGMTNELAKALAAKGILTQEDLAEQSVDDLADVASLDEEKAAALIMAARAPWFE